MRLRPGGWIGGWIGGGIGRQIALAALAVTTVALAIVALGVFVVGGRTFADLMAVHGQSTDASRTMFEESVGQVLLLAIGVAIVASAGLAAVLGPRLARPLRDVGAAAQRVAEGDYGTTISRRGPSEIANLADSFNRMAASLEEQERLRREFIANAAHELRTPLTNLQGYLEALRDGVIPAERATFESLWEEAERLVRLSRSLDVLAAGDAAPGPPRLVEFDLAEAIRSAVELVRPALRAADLELTVEGPNDLSGLANPDHLAQVLGNLLQNAVRYTPPDGRLTVRAERRAGNVIVSVENTGEGIPAVDLPHVFERFYRVEKSRDRGHGGAGIGLAIVRQLVEAGGGTVGVSSEGGLTRFWFTVPVAPAVGVGRRAPPDEADGPERAAGLDRASWLERAAAGSSRGLDRPAALGRTSRALSG